MKEPLQIRGFLTTGAKAGLATCASGFGVMYGFHKWGTYPLDLPGLFSYRSATWGDGLLLPLCAGALVVAARPLPVSSRETGTVCKAATVGVLVGAGLQALSGSLTLRPDSTGPCRNRTPSTLPVGITPSS
jgi:hypothetical protein